MGGRGLMLLAGRCRQAGGDVRVRGLCDVARSPVRDATSFSFEGVKTPTANPVVREQPLLFDTYRMVCALEAAGIPHNQSAALTDALVHVSQAAHRQATGQVVTKSEFVSLRSELSILEKADFAVLKADIAGLEKRLDTAVAEIYTAVERVENRVIKWVVAVAGALALGILRVTSGGGYSPKPTTVIAEPTQATTRDGVDEPRVRLLHI